MIDDLKVLANQRDVPYQSLLEVFLAERLKKAPPGFVSRALPARSPNARLREHLPSVPACSKAERRAAGPALVRGSVLGDSLEAVPRPASGVSARRSGKLVGSLFGDSESQ
jgi:hypothetical protein